MKWISVEDRLPEEVHVVALVWIGTVAIGRHIKTVGWTINSMPMDSQVTHWMSFPEAPKEDK